MPRMHLSERAAKAAKPGAKDQLLFDECCAGFALCVYASGNRSFVLIYRLAGRQRRFTIGAWPDWSVTAAREEAKRLKRDIDRGHDPLGERQEAREAATVTDLIDRYTAEHLPRLAARNAADQASMLRQLVQPEWGARKVVEIQPADVERLLAKVAEGRPRPRKRALDGRRRRKLTPARPTPIRANRCGEVLRKMFNLAIAWKIRPDNPALGFYRRAETERDRFLSMEEIGRLAQALDAAPDQRVADLIRLAMLTGARIGECRHARFDQFNLDLAIWTKQAAHTKQRRVHRVPISAAAVKLIRRRRADAPADCPWVFPGDARDELGQLKPLQDIRRFWASIRKAANLPDVCVHDLRHTFASLLVSSGASLEMIGKLLGHTQAKTTGRYAHLVDAPLRQGVNAVGDLLGTELKLVHSSEPPNRSNPAYGGASDSQVLKSGGRP